MKRWLLALVLALPLAAQVEEQVQKIVALKYVDPASIRNLLQLFGVSTSVDQRLKVVVVSGPKAKVASAEEAIKQLDVPGAAQKDIDLVVYFIVGSELPLPVAPGSTQAYGTIPPDLQSTVATLKGTFPFKTYYLLDTLSLRTRSGTGANTTGQLGGGRYTSFSVRGASLEADAGSIRLDNLHAGLRIPHTSEGKTNYVDTGISTEVVNVKEGQKLVVGRSSLDGPSTALFLVLIGKVVN